MTLTYEEMRALELTHVCGECGALLVVRWSAQKSCHELVCGENLFHTGYKKIMSYTEARARGYPIPLEIEQALQRKEEKEMSERFIEDEQAYEAEQDRKDWEEQQRQLHNPTTREKLPPICEATTGAVVKREQALEAIEWAKSVGLHPELGHVCLYFGKPWVEIDGWYFRFRIEHPLGRVITRPLNFNERKDLNVGEEVEAWQAEAFDKMGLCLGMGYGYASRDNETQLYKGVSEKWATAWRRAEKRAEEDCLRKVVPLELEPPSEEW